MSRIDRNFRMIRFENTINKEVKIVTALRARFDNRCLHDGKYIEKYNLDKTSFSKLMKRRVTGTNLKVADTTTGKIIVQLKKDGIWSGPLPWEDKDEEQRVS
jgi:hypothetical protein